METNNRNPETIKKVLGWTYQVLKFAPEEIKKTLENLFILQHVSILKVLLKNLTKEEVATLSKNIGTGTESEKEEIIKGIIANKNNDREFMSQIQLVAKKVLNDHIAYLKTRGDDGQKSEIAKILAEVE